MAVDKHPLNKQLLVSADYTGHLTFFRVHNDYISEAVGTGKRGEVGKKVKRE